jgi:hypothetical protein
VEIGDLIITRSGTVDPDLGLDISGWQGRVIEMDKGPRGQQMTCIEWDGPTLKRMPPEIIEKCEEDGLDWRVMWLDAREVELAKQLEHLPYQPEGEDELARVWRLQ